MKNERLTPKNAVEIKAPDSSAVAYLETTAGKWFAKGYSGKRGKPDFYYSFRTEAAALEYIARHAAGVKSREAYGIERRAQVAAAKCLTPLAVWEKARKEGGISAPDAAVCLRDALARAFPNVKFSVRSDSGLSVRWTDGPTVKEVAAIADGYSFQGFDGMADCRYSITHWLARDGSISIAKDAAGASGYHESIIGDPHSPDAVLVLHGPDFVSCSRAISPALKEQLTRKVCQRFGVATPADFNEPHSLERFINGTLVHFSSGSEYLSHLVYRASTGALEGVTL